MCQGSICKRLWYCSANLFWTKELHFQAHLHIPEQHIGKNNPCSAGHVAAHVMLLGKQSGINNEHAVIQDCSLGCFLASLDQT